jgi:hypothetical protein
MTNTLREDFEHFSKLHSWYKRNSLYGTTFYFFQNTGQQLSTGEQLKKFYGDLDLNNYDLSGIHWHFSIDKPTHIDTPIYEVKFNCFLRKLEGNSTMNIPFWIIYEDYQHTFHDWILEHYPEYKDVDWNKEIHEIVDSEFIKRLYTNEYNRMFSDVLKAINNRE